MFKWNAFQPDCLLPMCIFFVLFCFFNSQKFQNSALKSTKQTNIIRPKTQLSLGFIQPAQRLPWGTVHQTSTTKPRKNVNAFLTSHGARYLLEPQGSEGETSSYNLLMVATTSGTVSTTAIRQVWWVPEKMKGAKRREWACNDTLCFFFSLFLTLWCANTLLGSKPGGHLEYARSQGQLPTYTEFFKVFPNKHCRKG